MDTSSPASTTRLVAPMDFAFVNVTRARVVDFHQDTITKYAWLWPDGEIMGEPVFVRVPAKYGVRVPLTVEDMDTEVWLDSSRGACNSTEDLEDMSITIDRIPLDAPNALTFAYTVVVASQRREAGNVFPVNALVNKLVPGLANPWRGNVLVFRHGKTQKRKIIGVSESSREQVQSIIQYTISSQLVGTQDERSYLSVAAHSSLKHRPTHHHFTANMPPVTRASTRAIAHPHVTRTGPADALQRFWAINELLSQAVQYLNFIDLISFSQINNDSHAFGKALLHRRITRYTSPFFHIPGNVTTLFQVLDRTASWIVGSVSLAVVSVRSDPPIPNNLNIITSYLHLGTWTTFLESLGFLRITYRKCRGVYTNVGGYFSRFEHPKNEGMVITITTSAAKHISRLFFSAPHTVQQVAIGAYDIISPHVEMMANQEGLKGWSPWVALPTTVPYIRSEGTYKPASPFPGMVTLHNNTDDWKRPCGLACPARTRNAHGLRGIGHWKWGGMDGLDWNPDPSLEAMRLGRVGFRIGTECFNEFCDPSKWK
ncbi:hypothetical protein C8R43DRAFT_1143717 [Mycena crocata]|nr:hypothetical protein C8R43DRAFT_1143717 [Mycena crocata]